MSQSKILIEGNSLLTTSLTQQKKLKIKEYRIGNSSGFTPNGNETNPAGSLVYTGTETTIITSAISDEEIRYTITLDEGIGNFTVGNVVIYADLNDDNILKPFAMTSLDVGQQKIATLGAVQGNRIIIVFVLKLSNNTGSVSVVIPNVQKSSLPNYETENNLPNAESSPFRSLTIVSHSKLLKPAFGLKKESNNTWFGTPFMDRIDNPRFGWLWGGVCSDGRQLNYDIFIEGSYYPTSVSVEYDTGEYTTTNFIKIDNGGNY
jgi:hypothetical protein